jgi:tryptophan synthase alpha chain
MSGRLETTFKRLRDKGEKALIAYLMAGDPGLAETEQLVLALEEAGADIIELGVPFSDPIADGPVIQQAAERALRSGTSLRKILASVKLLRQRTEIPIVLMLYYNSIHAMGCGEFCAAASAAGVDGLIVPDMPPDEAGPLKGPAEAVGLPLIFLLAPTSTTDRRKLVARESHGFVYYVSLTGITGSKLSNVGDIQDNVKKTEESFTLSRRGRVRRGDSRGCGAGIENGRRRDRRQRHRETHCIPQQIPQWSNTSLNSSDR